MTMPTIEGSSAEPPHGASMPPVKPSIRPGGEQDHDGRADKEPGALLERFPAEAKADSVENSMAAPYHAAALAKLTGEISTTRKPARRAIGNLAERFHARLPTQAPPSWYQTFPAWFPPCNAYFFIATMRRHRSARLLRTLPASARPGFKPTDNRRNSSRHSVPPPCRSLSKFSCRCFGQPRPLLGLVAALSLLAGLTLASPSALSAEEPPLPPRRTAPPKETKAAS